MADVTEDRDQDGLDLSAADEQLLRKLTDRARTGGLKLTGDGGLLGKLTKVVIEGALEGGPDDHLGYSKHDPEGGNGGNSRNGYRAKTVITDTGPVEISVPRDRESSFDAVAVPGHAKADTAVRGTESDLLLWLTNRGSASSVEVLSKGDVAASWTQLRR